MRTVLCFLIKGKNVLLGMMKRGIGKGKWNGFGGKVEPDESPAAAAVRELREESGLIAEARDLIEVGTTWYAYPEGGGTDEVVTIFIAKKWRGEPKETKEMEPRWFAAAELPLDKMWENDREWLPLILKGKKFKARIAFEADGETTADSEIVTS